MKLETQFWNQLGIVGNGRVPTVPLQYTSGHDDCETISNPEIFPERPGVDIINLKSSTLVWNSWDSVQVRNAIRV